MIHEFLESAFIETAMTFRKSKREYFRIEEDTVTRVLNKELSSRIETIKSNLVRSDALDPDITKECSELEFTTAYKEAFDRISLMRIV